MHNLTFSEAIRDSELPPMNSAKNTVSHASVASTSTTVQIPEQEILQVADAVCRSTSLNSTQLPDEFYPGHLSVALIDAVCNSWRTKGRELAPELDASRYCRRFGIERTRALKLEIPAATEQEALGDFVRRFDAHGLDRMADEGFGIRALGGTAKREAVQRVLDAASALCQIGIDVLQDVYSRRPEEIETALQRVPGVGEESVRLLLMFSGEDHFVRGDESVRTFVASALGRRSVSAVYAEELVRRAAYELILSPRLLDYVLWTYSVCGNGLAKPPEISPLPQASEASKALVTGIPLRSTSRFPSPHD